MANPPVVVPRPRSRLGHVVSVSLGLRGGRPSPGASTFTWVHSWVESSKYQDVSRTRRAAPIFGHFGTFSPLSEILCAWSSSGAW